MECALRFGRNGAEMEKFFGDVSDFIFFCRVLTL
jgi:hypothetical protein